jgi:hypothetical protein
MLIEPITFGQLVDSGIRLSWREAVAITRRTAALCAHAAPGQPGGDLLADLTLDARGTVSVATAHRPAIAVSELALFLMQMLPSETAPADRRAPATVHLAIGRGLGLDDAPPFDSAAEFADALARTEQGWHPAPLGPVFTRCISRLSAADDPVPAADSPVLETEEQVVKDRRTSGPRVDALRRMIRERDHRDYLVCASPADASAADRQRDPSRDPFTSAPPAVVERQSFDRSRAPSTRRRSIVPFVGLGLAVVVAAGTGLLEQRWDEAGVPTGAVRTPRRETRSETAARTLARSDARTPQSAPKGDVATAGAKTSPAIPGYPITQPVTAASASRAASSAASELPDNELRPHRDRRAPVVVVRPQAAAAGAGHPAASRRWAPLRLFAAIGHKLSGKSHGA